MGINVGMGTDTSPSDMILNMQVGMRMCRTMDGGTGTFRSEDFFDAATIGGSAALRACSSIIASDRGVEQALSLCFKRQLCRRADAVICQRCLRRDDLGRLQAGAKADLVVIDLDRPSLGQVIDPIQTLLLAGRGDDVRSVMIDGRRAMHDRIIPGIDEVAEAARAQAQFDRVMAKYPERTWGHPPVAEIFSSAYPIERRPA